MKERSATSCSAVSAALAPLPATRWAPRPASETTAVGPFVRPDPDAPDDPADADEPDEADDSAKGWDNVRSPIGPDTAPWGSTMWPYCGASWSTPLWPSAAAATHVPPVVWRSTLGDASTWAPRWSWAL